MKNQFPKGFCQKFNSVAEEIGSMLRIELGRGRFRFFEVTSIYSASVTMYPIDAVRADQYLDKHPALRAALETRTA